MTSTTSAPREDDSLQPIAVGTLCIVAILLAAASGSWIAVLAVTAVLAGFLVSGST